MFNKTAAPLQVGSFLRNTHFGSRIMVVTTVVGNRVFFKSYGRTYYGEFKGAGKIVKRVGMHEGRGMVTVRHIAGTGRITHGSYQHVVKGSSMQ